MTQTFDLSFGTFNNYYEKYPCSKSALQGMPWARRKELVFHDIAHALQKNVVFFATEETTREAFQEIQSRFQLGGAHAIHFGKQEGVAVFWNKGVFDLKDIRTSRERLTSGKRALFVDLIHKVSGAVFRVMALHASGGANRALGDQEIEMALFHMDHPATPTTVSPHFYVVLGDLNEEMSNPNHRIRKKFFDKGFLSHRNKALVTEPSKGRQIDWGFIKPRSAECKAEFIHSEALETVGSDHNFLRYQARFSILTGVQVSPPSISKASSGIDCSSVARVVASIAIVSLLMSLILFF